MTSADLAVNKVRQAKYTAKIINGINRIIWFLDMVFSFKYIKRKSGTGRVIAPPEKQVPEMANNNQEIQIKYELFFLELSTTE